MRAICLFLLAAPLIASSQYIVVKKGACPDVKVQQNLDLKRYMGRWFEITKYPVFFEKGTKCVTAEYELKENGKVRVNNTGIYPDGSLSTLEGEAGFAAEEGTGKLEVRFFANSPPGPYWVLDTNYQIYSLVWSCSPLSDGSHSEALWILSRTPSLDQEVVRRLKLEIESLGLTTEELVDTPQNCGDNALRSPANGAAVFREGPCPNPEIQEPFDVPLYAGKWYTVVGNPTLFESGSKCTTATYVLEEGGDRVRLNNTAFNYDGTLDTVGGEAFPAVPDTGKLVVKLDGTNFEGPYWVLSTDYTSYALVWSCTQFGDVHNEDLWILSRTSTLSQETRDRAEQIITARGLSSDDFVETLQDCEQPSKSVPKSSNPLSRAVFSMGKCPQLKVVEPFDLEAYLGKWYEQWRYPNFFEGAEGETRCVTAQYSHLPSGHVLVNNTATYSNGTRSSGLADAIIPTSGVAKLKVSFSPQTPSGPYWVLDTDYKTYAIVWSCSSYGNFNARNLWILSREKSVPKEMMDSLKKKIESLGLSTTELMPTDQSCSGT